MPATLRSSIYFSATKALSKALDLIGDPIGRFYSSKDMETFAKRSNQSAVQKSITGILTSSNHQVCSEVMKSPNWISRPFAEKLYVAANTYEPDAIHPFLDSIIAMDGPEQRRIKKVLHTAFTKGVIDNWKQDSERVITKLLSNIEDLSNFDFVASIANPLPLEIISEIIGVPDEFRADCNMWGKVLGSIGLDLPTNNYELEELEEATLGITNLFQTLLDQRRKNPQEDLLSVMAFADADGEKLTDKEIIASASFTLIAGFETTANLLAVGTKALLENPDQLALLAQKKELIPNFVEESLRISSPIQFVVRTADSQLTLADGTKAKKGQTIILNLAGANRDSSVFESADEFLIERENARKNIAFGFGAHHCIGSQLARVEAEVLFRILLERFPDVTKWKLRGEPKPRAGKLIKGLDTLPAGLVG